MTERELPWISGAVIEVLAESPRLAELVEDRISSRARRNMTRPSLTVQTLTTVPESVASATVLDVPLVQVDAWCPEQSTEDEDPAVVVWRIAAACKPVLLAVTGRVARTYDGYVWSVRRFVDGPLEHIDTTRGQSTPFYGCRSRFALKFQAA